MITNKDWKTIWTKLWTLIKSMIGDVDVKEKGTIQAQLDNKAEADGSNASGNWGINITGNAKTATKATSADKLNTNAGSATQPTYFADGIPKACTHTLEKSVPANAVFTDTKYTNQIGMTTLGFTKNATYTVYEFFTAIYEKGYSGKISLRFRYDSSSTAKISDGTTTIDMSGVDCYLSVYGDVNSTWKKNYALLSVQKKLYLLYCIHDGDATKPSSQGIVDVTTMKAVQDGNGNVIADTYLPLTGGTMNKGASIIVPYTVDDDRYIKITGDTIMNYFPSNTGYAGGLNWYDQSENLLGSMGLYGSKGIPEYYYVGSYSDPFIKVDMEGNTTIKKKLTVNSTSYINGLTTLFVKKSDTTGYPSYLLAFDITDWFLNGSRSKSGFNGHVYSDRSGGHMGQEEVAIVIMDCGYTKATTIGQTLRLTTNNGNYRPCMIHDTVNDKYYLALKISGQDRRLIFHGKVSGTMSTTQIKATDGSGTLPTGYEFTFDPANCTIGMGISSSCSGNSKTASGLGIYGTEPIKSISDDTYENWLKLPGCSVSWYNTNGHINGQPSRYGFLLNLSDGIGDVHQLWFEQVGNMYRRAGNYNGLTDWYEMLDSNNYSNYAIPLTGTTALAGDITPETNNKYDLGDATHRFYYGYFENIYAKQSLHSLYHYIEDSSGVNQGRLEYSGLTDVMYSSYVSTSTNDLTKSDIVGIDLYGYTNLRVRAQNRLYFNAGTTISASMSIATGSDEKIKKFTDDIEQDKEALIKLFDIIQIKSYRYRYSKGNALTLGFSAQDVEEACNEIGIDPEKYGILNISYNHHMCQGEEEDMKYYPKFYEISYNDMYNLALFKIQSMEKEHKEILEEHNNRLKALEEKLV